MKLSQSNEVFLKTLENRQLTSSTRPFGQFSLVFKIDCCNKILERLTADESFNPEELWKWMEAYEEKTGARVLALAPNGNVSNGLVFPEINPVTGKPLSKNYAETRSRWEPIYEVTQIKGDGESHPYLSPNDEFAGYDTSWDKQDYSHFYLLLYVLGVHHV